MMTLNDTQKKFAFRNQPSQQSSNIGFQQIEPLDLPSQQLQHFQTPGPLFIKREKQHKLFSIDAPVSRHLSTPDHSSNKNSYSYFKNLFGHENQRALAKELKQTVSSVQSKSQAGLPPTLSKMEFKIALIRKQQM